MPREDAQGRCDRGAGACHGLGLRVDHAHDLGDQPVRGGVEQLHEDRFLGREVEVDAALGGVRLPGDVVDRGLAIAGAAEDVERRIEDALSPLPGPLVVRGACLAVHASPSVARRGRLPSGATNRPTSRSVPGHGSPRAPGCRRDILRRTTTCERPFASCRAGWRHAATSCVRWKRPAPHPCPTSSRHRPRRPTCHIRPPRPSCRPAIPRLLASGDQAPRGRRRRAALS